MRGVPKVFSTIGKIAGAVSTIARLIPGGQVVAAIAGPVAVVAGVAGALTAKKPPARGSTSQVQIGVNLPTPYPMGRTYIGGNLIHDVGYGGKVSGVPNPYATMTFVYGLGPIKGIESFQADFAPIPLNGNAATGYYGGSIYIDRLLGNQPEARALAANWAGEPGWSAAHKLSGKVCAKWSFRFDKNGKIFAGGFPALGLITELGVSAYDPRGDSTYPGGSGPQRLNDEKSWGYSANPALHAGSYAHGRYQNDKKVFGVDLGNNGIDWPTIVAWANVCDANNWRVSGTIFEPGDRANNLKLICQAGCAEYAFRGGLLTFKFSAPRVSLDTVTPDDIADEAIRVTGYRPPEERKNGLIPLYRSEAHQWELVQSDLIEVPAYVTDDLEERRDENPLDLVSDMNQAAQLTRYRLEDGRELGPIIFMAKPRLAGYGPGDCLTLNIPDEGLSNLAVVITGRTPDIARGTFQFECVSETMAKHAFALGQTGTAPPVRTLVTPQERDNVAFDISNRTGIPEERFNPLALYDFGRIVSLGDGARYRYINDAATMGTAPPNLLFWTMLSPPTVAGDIGANRITLGPTRPSVDDSGIGDRWSDSGGGNREQMRVGSSVVIGGFIPVIGGFRLSMPWVSSQDLGIPAAQVAADQANTTAQASAASASLANASLAEIASDAILTPGEKPIVILDRDNIINEQAGIDAGAAALGITTEKATYDASVTALTGYLATLSVPSLWYDLNGNTAIDGAAFRAKFADVYAARQVLLNKIALVASTKAAWAGVIGPGKADDYADVTASAQITVLTPNLINIACDYLGVPVAYPVAIRIGASVTKGAASIKLANNTSYTATLSGCSSSAGINTTNGSATKGEIVIDAITSNSGWVDIIVTVAGIAQPAQRTLINKQLANPPQMGGSGSKIVYDTTLNPINTASYVQISDTMMLTLATGERLVGSGSLDYIVTGSGGAMRTATVIWGYRLPLGGSFTAFNAATLISGSTPAGIAGSPGKAQFYNVIDEATEEPNPGHVDADLIKTGLAAGNYEVALFALVNATGRSLSWTGTAICEAKI